VVSKVASTPGEVETYAQCTLLAASLAAASHEEQRTREEQSSVSCVKACVKACVDYLHDNEFIAHRTTTGSGFLNISFFSSYLLFIIKSIYLHHRFAVLGDLFI